MHILVKCAYALVGSKVQNIYIECIIPYSYCKFIQYQQE